MESAGSTPRHRSRPAASAVKWRFSSLPPLLSIAVTLVAAPGRAEEHRWPTTARREIVEELLGDLRAPHHRSDGGGSARLFSEPVVEAGGRGVWKIEYEAGPFGVAPGGSVQLQVSPFWGWSDPQNFEPAFPGYTTATTDAAGTSLDLEECGQGCLAAKVEGAGLGAGNHILFVYGAGSAAAVADRYAEHAERFRIWVDGDGDGTRSLIRQSPTLTVKAGAPARIVAFLPSTAGVGNKVPLTIAFLDARANAAPGFAGELKIHARNGIAFPTKVDVAMADNGHKRIYGLAGAAGIYRVEVLAPGGMSARSNPIEITEGEPRQIRWADLHGHTNVSDGTGSLDDYYIYARDFAGLDVAAATDHDHWGLGFLDQNPDVWAAVQATADRHYQPGTFVSVAGYEWTSWIYGHRHVLYFSPPMKLFSSLDRHTDTPAELWKALKATGSAVITVAHHPGGGPVALDWSFPPDSLLEPVVEVVSVHGSSECYRGPGRIYHPQDGHFVCDALARKYRLGMIGSGDGHDGHPGSSHLGAPSGGLAALIGAELTREGALATLRSRRVYATSGERMILEFRLGAHPMGSVVRAMPGGENDPYQGRVVGTAPIASLELIKNGAVIASVGGHGRMEASLSYLDRSRQSGDWAYLRAVQAGGGMAWSSPIWTD